jgi:Bromodomain/TAZ zinc finger/PHD-finger
VILTPVTSALLVSRSVKLLKKDKGGTPEAMAKLPQMAKQLEVSLYRNAPSFEYYRDMTTLKKRLQHIAAEVQRKARGGVDDRSRYDGGGGGTGSSRGGGQMPTSSSSSQPAIMGHAPQQQQINMHVPEAGGTSPYMGSSSNRGLMDESSSSMMRQQQQHMGSYSMSRGMPDSRMGQNRQPPTSQAAGMLDGSSNRNDPEWRQRIKHKQQRLLLLHHSAKCPHEDGTCPVTQHCADMKRLWRHMEGCKDNNCRVPHCFSSRAILSHYRKCKDPSCPACGPVRQTVRKAKASGASGGVASSSSPYGSSRPGGLAGPGMGSSSMRGQPLLQHGHPQMPGSQVAGQAPQQHGMMQASEALMPSSSFQSTSSSVGASSFQQPRNASMPPPLGSRQPHAPPHQQQQQPAHHRSADPINGYAQYGIDDHADAQNLNRLDSITLPPPKGPAGRQDTSEWQKIRHKQQRLLLLRHASRCQHEAGKCPVTPHCASMKKLWEHIAGCKNQQCTVQHCLSSRYVLSHYRRCKDVDCPACGPVRETIRKSHEREQRRKQGMPSSGEMPLVSLSTEPASDVGFGESPTDSYQPETKRAKYEPHLPPGPTSSAELPVDGPVTSQADDVCHPVISSSSEAGAPAAQAGGSERETSSKATADLSLLQSFTVSQLQTHLASLDRKTQLPPAKLKTKCQDVLKGLQTHQHGWVFNCPVDPVELGLPDYFDIIKKPMDLGTVQKKLENGVYHSIEDFQIDVFLTFDNAMTYNEDGSVVFDMAKELRVKFEGDLKKLMAQLEAEDLERRQNERACTLCGCEKLMFEPPVYFCNGMNCQNQRIRRNSHFYIGGNNQYFWCTTCFNELDDKIPIELIDMTIVKSDLKKKKNDEVHEESWVQCDTCQRWVHQICGLFNGRQNTQQHSEYCCPRCLRENQLSGKVTPTERPPGAAELPRTMLSEWLERHIMKRVERQKRRLAEEKATAEVRIL